eukprot:TRINITY_DN37484_c0_g1_i1.p1 TRINITY_DN37484_c0_g1~~TRINITY_DN37484_c0_g1_i1.p1  ORF type:complete len:1406 (+),score=268.89 TRINITY_DN37484_c0_g1_i1:312-4220(+)
MAVDGCAPRAKMNQQRSRRFRAANDAREDREAKIARGDSLEGTSFDSNCITPGTEFMAKLTEHLRFFVQRQMDIDPLWQRLTVVVSGPDVPGEGEHKIMDYIRTIKAQPGFNPNLRHCLYGLDADLIMLALATHEPHFALLREEVVFGKQQTKTVEERLLLKPDRFQLLHISLLREYLELELSFEAHFTFDLERAIDDFILFCILVGNDFLPHLPMAGISDGGLDDLFSSYKAHLREATCQEPWLVKNCGEVAFDQLKSFFTIYATHEDEKLQTVLDDGGFVLGMRRLVGPPDAPDPPNRRAAEQASPPTTELARVVFYDRKFNLDIQTYEGTQKRRDVFASFLEGVQWVLLYYFRGPDQASWSWYYPYYHAPMVFDLVDFDRLADPKINLNIGQAFLPFQQLMAVLPAASKTLLPKCYQALFDSPESPILEFYPQKFEIDIDGVKVPWGGVSMIPWINPEALLAAMAQAESEGPPFDEATRKRNRVGEARSFVYTNSTSFVNSTMPTRFPSIQRSRVRMARFEHPSIPPGKYFPNVVPEGCQAVAQGFPTLKRHPIYITRESGVKVFQFEARGQSLIVHLRPNGPVLPSEEVMRRALAAPVVQIDYPFVHRGKVVAVHTSTVTLLPNGRSTGGNSGEHRDRVRTMLSDWRYRGLTVEFGSKPLSKHTKQDANESLLQAVAEVRVLDNSFVDDVGRTQYNYKSEPHFRLFHLLTTPEEAPALVVPRPLSERFPVGQRVLCVSKEKESFGHVGFVTTSSDDTSQIEARCDVQMSVAEQATLQQQLQEIVQRQHAMLKWHELPQLARLANVNPDATKMIVGTLHFRCSQRVREDIGMSMMCEVRNSNTQYCLPAYSCRRSGTWLFSDLAVDALKDYASKFPNLFEAIKNRRPNDRDVDAKWVFGDSPTLDNDARRLIKYCNSCDFKKLRLTPVQYMALAPKAIAEVCEALNAAKAKAESRQQRVDVLSYKCLFRPEEPGSTQRISAIRNKLEQTNREGTNMPEGVDFRIGQRGVVIRSNMLVPWGTRCTIVGVYASVTMGNPKLEVILDDGSFGGNNLQGRGPAMRGLLLPSQAVMPLPVPKRATATDKAPTDRSEVAKEASAPTSVSASHPANMPDAGAVLKKLLQSGASELAGVAEYVSAPAVSAVGLPPSPQPVASPSTSLSAAPATDIAGSQLNMRGASSPPVEGACGARSSSTEKLQNLVNTHPASNGGSVADAAAAAVPTVDAGATATSGKGGVAEGSQQLAGTAGNPGRRQAGKGKGGGGRGGPTQASGMNGAQKHSSYKTLWNDAFNALLQLGNAK